MQSDSLLLEGIPILEQLFVTMNELLAEISTLYATAEGQAKVNLDDQLDMLKRMSDQYMEQWLEFEQNLTDFYTANKQESPIISTDPVHSIEAVGKSPDMGFLKAQGYYQLYMFEQAVKELEIVIKQAPEDIMVRIYLAMGYLRLGEDGDAYPHFQMIVPLTDNNQLKAISYNGMGCIQLKRNNFLKAKEYFQLAYHWDPNSLPN